MAVDLDVHVDIDSGQRFSPHSQLLPVEHRIEYVTRHGVGGGARESPRQQNNQET